MMERAEKEFWIDVERETRARVALYIACRELERDCLYATHDAIYEACAPVNYTKSRFRSDEFQNAFENAREQYWYNRYCNGTLERDVEYLDVITRNGGFGVSLTGEYWSRYRRILAWKLTGDADSPNWTQIFDFNASGKRPKVKCPENN